MHRESANETVVVVGSANADLVVNAPRHPKPGETIMGTSFAIHRGGKGANQAVAASRAGASVVLIGRLGNDPNAAMLREGLQADRVFDRFVGNCKHDPSGAALITVDDAGENSIVVVRERTHFYGQPTLRMRQRPECSRTQRWFSPNSRCRSKRSYERSSSDAKPVR